MKLKYIGLILLILVAGCSKSPREKVKAHLQDGYDYLDKFDFAKAQEAFDKAAAEAKGYPYDRYGKGLILENRLLYYDALNEYIELTKLFPDSALAFSGVYRMYSKFGFYGRALKAAARYYDLAPQSEDAAIARFMSYIKLGEYRQALFDIEKTKAEAVDKVTANLLSALAYGYMNQFDSSQLFMDRVGAIETLTPYQKSVFSDVLDVAGLADSAMIVSRKSAVEEGNSAFRLLQHFDRALANNYYADAREVIHTYEKRGASKEITLALQVMLAKDQKNYTKSRIIDSDYLMAAQKTVSSMLFDMAAGGKEYADPLLSLSLASSINFFMDASQYNNELKAFVDLQILLFRAHTDDRIAVWESLDKLIGEDAQIKQVVLTKAYLLYRTGQFDAAIKELRTLRTLNTNNPDILAEIADIYAHPTIHLNDTALKVYDDALAKDKWCRQAFVNKVRLLLSLGRTQDALVQFDKFPNFERTFHDLALLKSICLATHDEFDKAFEIFSNRGKFLKGNVSAINEFGTLLEKKYRQNELLKFAETCSNWAGDNADLLLIAARIYSDFGDFSKSQSLTEKTLALEPNLIEAKVQNARALYGLGKRTDAFDILDEVMKEDAADGNVNYYYSQILAKEKIDHNRATNMARSALRAYYSDEKAFINICEVYNAYGDYKYAYGDASKASSEFPNSPEVHYELGLASFNMGRANTDQHLKRAIELGLGGEKLARAKEILAKL